MGGNSKHHQSMCDSKSHDDYIPIDAHRVKVRVRCLRNKHPLDKTLTPRGVVTHSPPSPAWNHMEIISMKKGSMPPTHPPGRLRMGAQEL